MWKDLEADLWPAVGVWVDEDVQCACSRHGVDLVGVLSEIEAEERLAKEISVPLRFVDLRQCKGGAKDDLLESVRRILLGHDEQFCTQDFLLGPKSDLHGFRLQGTDSPWIREVYKEVYQNSPKEPTFLDRPQVLLIVSPTDHPLDLIFDGLPSEWSAVFNELYNYVLHYHPLELLDKLARGEGGVGELLREFVSSIRSAIDRRESSKHSKTPATKLALYHEALIHGERSLPGQDPLHPKEAAFMETVLKISSTLQRAGSVTDDFFVADGKLIFSPRHTIRAAFMLFSERHIKALCDLQFWEQSEDFRPLRAVCFEALAGFCVREKPRKAILYLNHAASDYLCAKLNGHAIRCAGAAQSMLLAGCDPGAIFICGMSSEEILRTTVPSNAWLPLNMSLLSVVADACYNAGMYELAYELRFYKFCDGGSLLKLSIVGSHIELFRFTMKRRLFDASLSLPIEMTELDKFFRAKTRSVNALQWDDPKKAPHVFVAGEKFVLMLKVKPIYEGLVYQNTDFELQYDAETETPLPKMEALEYSDLPKGNFPFAQGVERYPLGSETRDFDIALVRTECAGGENTFSYEVEVHHPGHYTFKGFRFKFCNASVENEASPVDFYVGAGQPRLTANAVLFDMETIKINISNFGTKEASIVYLVHKLPPDYHLFDRSYENKNICCVPILDGTGEVIEPNTKLGLCIPFGAPDGDVSLPTALFYWCGPLGWKRFRFEIHIKCFSMK